MGTKPVTVNARSLGGVASEVQRKGLDHVVEYLANALHPGPMLPLTGRIVIEWGDEDELEELRAC